MTRHAVILFNLGGPDSPAAVQPFLFNLFNDPAIIGAPAPLRYLLARFISARRAPKARGIYDQIGGKSPILPETEAQARALEQVLRARHPSDETRVFIVMRYWHPRADAVVAEVQRFAPDRVTLLPLYPQFSTSTSQSSFEEWHRAAAKKGLKVETRSFCCYPNQPGFIEAQADLIRAAQAQIKTPYRILFSAHGLPEKTVRAGDPYQMQVEATARALLDALVAAPDSVVCYQSRVGPLKWIGPSTEDEITRAGREGLGVLLVPLAFVSEHSETLVELDIEYRELAAHAGVPQYERVSTVRDHPAFIAGLADAVERARPGLAPMAPWPGCGDWAKCPQKS